MEIWQEIALKNVISAIDDAGLSQAALSKKAKMSYSHLNAVLKGKRPLTRQFIKTMSHHLGRPSEWFYLDHSKEVEPVPEHISPSAIRGPLTAKDCAVILSRFADISPERRAVVLGILFDDASLVPESPAGLLQLLSTIG